MTPAEQNRFESNPAIAAMGLDIVPRLTEELTDRCKNVDFGDVRAPDAAKPKALVCKPFTGNPPWREWLARFQNVTLANQHTNRQALVLLKEALSEGPGKLALQRFNEYGDGTLKSLVEHATHNLVRVGEKDPKAQLARRIQKPDEDIRVFGFAIQELVSELYQGCRQDTPVVIQEATTRFVNGVRDPGCQAFLREKWEPECCLATLFNLADVYEAKKAVFPGLGVSSVHQTNYAAEDAESVDCAAYRGKEKNNNRTVAGAPGKGAAVVAGADIQKVVEESVEKSVTKALKWKKRGKRVVTCFRCQKSGHMAQDCKAPAPIPKTVKTDSQKPTGN